MLWPPSSATDLVSSYSPTAPLALFRSGLIRTYSYVIVDPTASKRQTLSYEYFEKGKWLYDHEKMIKTLEKTVKTQGPSKARKVAA